MKKVVTVVKTVGSLGVSVGIGAVASNLVLLTTPPGTSGIVKACIKVGSYAISGLASEAASSQFGKKVDNIASVFKRFKGIKDQMDSMETQEEVKESLEETKEIVDSILENQENKEA